MHFANCSLLAPYKICNISHGSQNQPRWLWHPVTIPVIFALCPRHSHLPFVLPKHPTPSQTLDAWFCSLESPRLALSPRVSARRAAHVRGLHWWSFLEWSTTSLSNPYHLGPPVFFFSCIVSYDSYYSFVTDYFMICSLYPAGCQRGHTDLDRTLDQHLTSWTQ